MFFKPQMADNFSILEVSPDPLVECTGFSNRSASGSTDFVAMAETPDLVEENRFRSK